MSVIIFYLLASLNFFLLERFGHLLRHDRIVLENWGQVSERLSFIIVGIIYTLHRKTLFCMNERTYVCI